MANNQEILQKELDNHYIDAEVYIFLTEKEIGTVLTKKEKALFKVGFVAGIDFIESRVTQ
jgi:hypothetical protein